jgi:dihydrodipicolinate synthase/N-acetylneuraminate lyase
MAARVVVALLTPFGSSGEPDVAALAAHVEQLVDAGVDALMPCGTTGEGPLLEPDEALRVIAGTVRAARGRVPVQAHVGRPSTAATVELARRALAEGATAVSAVVPYYYALAEEHVVAHYRAVLHAVDAPVYAYTIPARTRNELSTAAVRELAGDGLAGVKDSTKSLDRLREYLACGVDVLVGTDAFVLEAFRLGAGGCVSALANVRPDLLCAIRDRGDEAAQAEIVALRERLPMRALKAAVAEALPGYPIAYRAPL